MQTLEFVSGLHNCLELSRAGEPFLNLGNSIEYLVAKSHRTQQGSIILIYLTELFLKRNEIILAIREKICSLPSSAGSLRSGPILAVLIHSL